MRFNFKKKFHATFEKDSLVIKNNLLEGSARLKLTFSKDRFGKDRIQDSFFYLIDFTKNEAKRDGKLVADEVNPSPTQKFWKAFKDLREDVDAKEIRAPLTLPSSSPYFLHARFIIPPSASIPVHTFFLMHWVCGRPSSNLLMAPLSAHVRNLEEKEKIDVLILETMDKGKEDLFFEEEIRETEKRPKNPKELLSTFENSAFKGWSLEDGGFSLFS